MRMCEDYIIANLLRERRIMTLFYERPTEWPSRRMKLSVQPQNRAWNTRNIS
jgi:hypothetical protein